MNGNQISRKNSDSSSRMVGDQWSDGHMNLGTSADI